MAEERRGPHAIIATSGTTFVRCNCGRMYASAEDHASHVKTEELRDAAPAMAEALKEAEGALDKLITHWGDREVLNNHVPHFLRPIRDKANAALALVHGEKPS